MNHKSKNPVEKRSPMSEWKIQQRANDIKTLEIAKNQNKTVRYLIK